jgi:hypothetical protein
MKKITLAIGFYSSFLFSANAQNSKADSSHYEARKLKLEEINLVASYYKQDGNNSAVTGGIGTELLTDIGTTIDLKVSKYDAKKRQHFFSFDLGIEHYTSASSDKIDPRTVSSASREDLHVYPSLSWNRKDIKKGINFGVTASYSTEYDYKSYGGTLNFAKNSKDNSREFGIKVMTFLDKWSVILPAELRPANYGSGAERDFAPIDHKPRNSYSSTFSFSQIINRRMQAIFMFDPSFQEGLLSTPYHRIYFSNKSETVEKLPGTRFKFPIGMRLNYFYGDKIIIRTFYRFYQDNWGMTAHTISLEAPIKLTPFVSLSPFYRFHSQNAVKYYAPYQAHLASEEFYTSDSDLSKLTSHYFGTGLRLAPPNGVFGIKNLNNLEVRYGHYTRSNGLASDIVTLLFKVK